jgi:threonine synthase
MSARAEGSVEADVACSSCTRPYPESGFPHRCPSCGGLYEFAARTSGSLDPARIDSRQPGIWRYRHTFGLPEGVAPVSLGEGNTPLIWAQAFGRPVAFKCEYLNPTGSFKDRGSSLLATWLKARDVSEVVEDSSGNAGASLAAYAARAGIKTRIFIPASAAGVKRSQIEAYGAELVLVAGSRADAGQAVRKAAAEGAAYASHASLPFNLPGYATAAYEIFDQLDGQQPGAVVVPVGQGGLLLGLYRGFQALQLAGLTSGIPKLVGIQARACAPLWALFSAGPAGMGFVAENQTLAEGVRVRFPVRGDGVIHAVQASRGLVLAVDEEEILPGRDKLGALGFYVEPTSAIIWPGLQQAVRDLPDPLVVVLTGSGYKTSRN